MTDLQTTIEQAWEARDKVNLETRGPVRDAVNAALDLLDSGKARVAERLLVPAVELGGHLVPPARPAGAASDHRDVIEAEGGEHRRLRHRRRHDPRAAPEADHGPGGRLLHTSNYPPDGLYPEGLHRNRFLPTIELIKQRLDVVHVDSAMDYRQRALEQIEVYHTPLDAGAHEALMKTFRRIADVEEEFHELDVGGRVIPYRHRDCGVVWFEFDTLCGGPRSHLDYLDLAKRFHTVILSGVPRLSSRRANEARRLTWLVDVFYDTKVKLVVSAEVPPEQIYTEGVYANEFAMRTASRLVDMQSKEYLNEPRRGIDGAPAVAAAAGGA